MSRIFRFLESFLYLIRDAVWFYPELFVGKRSLFSLLKKLYFGFVPFSHYIVSILLSLFILFFVLIKPIGAIVSIDETSILIEGVVIGTDEKGQINKITSINPIVSSNLQIERDVVELIYEPLLKVVYNFNRSPSDKFDQTYRLYLAKEIVTVSTGSEYLIVLRDDVYWHDGVKFSAKDVVHTFNMISKFDVSIGSSAALKQMIWETVGDKMVRICTKINENSKSCNEAGEKPFFANFLELISFKILPEHRSKDINKNNFDTNLPILYKEPVGTGPYKFVGVNDHFLIMNLNENYYRQDYSPSIKQIKFKFFKSVDKAIVSLKSSEIHSFATTSIYNKKAFSNSKVIIANLSPVFYDQYWALYMNLRKDPNGNTLGSKFLQDKRVRKAISLAINRSEMINVALEGVGKVAKGTIPDISVFFNVDVNASEYDIDKANKLLDDAGWIKYDANKFRINENGEELAIKLYHVDAYDRNVLAKYLQTALKRVGINLILYSDENLNGLSLSELNNQYVVTGLFDVLLYGVTTFIDPDRYELFHSSQIKFPGLNLSGYVGTEQSVIIGEKDGKKSIVSIPKVDKILQENRGLDPEKLYDNRKLKYLEFQSLLADDMPVIFLYHPQFIYYTNIKVKNIDLTNVSSLEERFLHINNFYIIK